MIYDAAITLSVTLYFDAIRGCGDSQIDWL